MQLHPAILVLLLGYGACSVNPKTAEAPKTETPLVEETLFARSLLASIGYNLTKLGQLRDDLLNRGFYIQRVDEEQFEQFQTAAKKRNRGMDVVVDGKYSFLATFKESMKASTSGDRSRFRLWRNILNGTFLHEEQVSKFLRGLGYDRFEEQLFFYLPQVDEARFAEWVEGLIEQQAGPLAFKWLFRLVPVNSIVSPACLRLFAQADPSMIDPQTAALIFRRLTYNPTTEQVNAIIEKGQAAPPLVDEAVIRIKPNKETMLALVRGGYQKVYEETIAYDKRLKFYFVEMLASRKWGRLRYLNFIE